MRVKMTKGDEYDDHQKTVEEELPENELNGDEAVEQPDEEEPEEPQSGEMENQNPSENADLPVEDSSAVPVGGNDESAPTEEEEPEQASTEPGSDDPPPPPSSGNTDAAAGADVPNGSKNEGDDDVNVPSGNQTEAGMPPNDVILVSKVEENENGEDSEDEDDDNRTNENVMKEEEEEEPKHEVAVTEETPTVNDEGSKQSFYWGLQVGDEGGSESGTEEEQAAFMTELENFFKERGMEFKPPKFYGEGLNCLKLFRGVTRLGGYDQVTTGKLWRQVGETFKPPKTCTTVSWTFRGFYEKALLDYERQKMHGGEFHIPDPSFTDPTSVENQLVGQAPGSGRARRDAAARAMQGWHSQRLLGNGEVSDPVIKDKNAMSAPKRDIQLKSIGVPKRKKPADVEPTVKAARTITKAAKPHLETTVVDIGPSADWVKVNVRRTKDCFEVYALVPGLLREEVRVQSDPAGRVVISGEPEQPDNPWGVTPFKKVISLPSRIDPHQTSAVVTLHGQLFVRVPFEQSD